MADILPYLKTILRGVKGIIPNDIYIDEDRVIIWINSGSNVTKLREQLVKRIKKTWLAEYIDKIELKQGFYQITFKNPAETLEETINEALELTIDKNGLKMETDEVVIRNYDKIVGYAGRARKPMVDWVTEYNYICEKEMTQEEFENLLKEKGHNPTGMISYSKRKLRYNNGKIYFRHICYAVNF